MSPNAAETDLAAAGRSDDLGDTIDYERLVFEFEDEDAINVDLVDYH